METSYNLFAVVLGSGLLLTNACTKARSDSPPQSPPETALSQSSAVEQPLPAAAPVGSAFETRTKYKKLASASTEGCPPISPNKLYRFVEGSDPCMVEMAGTDVAAKLNDPFGTSVLQPGGRPDSVDEILTAMAPAGLNQQSFLVGEGSQVPATTEVPRSADRNLRYVVAWVSDSNAPGAFLSAAPGGHSSFLQLIGWDAKNAVFNFYEHRAQVGGGGAKAWSWAGETKMAPTVANHGVGCFDCHHNGVPIMKELTSPWNNWHSELAVVAPSNVPEAVAEEKLFQDRAGGNQLEPLIRSAYQTYYQEWLRGNYQRQTDGTVKLTQVDEMLRRLTMNTTVNFASSQIQSRGHATSPPDAPLTGIPNHLFLWDDLLRTSSVALSYQVPALSFPRNEYDAFLTEKDFELVQNDAAPSYSVPGSTWFSFFVPVPAPEDQYLVLQLLSAKVFSDKFVAAVLLVDFPNPVFSAKRSSLQKYAAQMTTGSISAGKSSVVEDFVVLVTAAAKQQGKCTQAFLECSAEQQFLMTWSLPESSWRATSSKLVQGYLSKVVAESSLARVMNLAQQRRDAFATTPVIKNLNEFSLLLPKNKIETE